MIKINVIAFYYVIINFETILFYGIHQNFHSKALKIEFFLIFRFFPFFFS